MIEFSSIVRPCIDDARLATSNYEFWHGLAFYYYLRLCKLKSALEFINWNWLLLFETCTFTTWAVPPSWARRRTKITYRGADGVVWGWWGIFQSNSMESLSSARSDKDYMGCIKYTHQDTIGNGILQFCLSPSCGEMTGPLRCKYSH